MARALTPPAPRADAVVAGDHRRPMHPSGGTSAAPGRVGDSASGAGQPEPRGLPRGTALLVATGVPHDPHMAVHALEDRPEDTGHLVVHQRGGPAWLKEHVTALRSWASTVAGAEIRLHDHPAISPGDTRALSMDQLTHSHPDVRWHSTDLNAGWLSPTGYYWIPEAWGHTSSDASGGGPLQTRHQRRSRRRPHPHVGGCHLGHGA